MKVLGASFDTQAENAAFAKKFGYTFPLLCDTTRQLGLAYGACDDAKADHAKRITYVIGQGATILQVHGKVNAKTHPSELLESFGTKGGSP